MVMAVVMVMVKVGGQSYTCSSARMGARPVPGPIIVMGVASARGRRKDEARTKILHAGGGGEERCAEARPVKARPEAVTCCETLSVTWTVSGCTLLLEDMV